MQRRNFMEAVVALAASRWDEEDYDVEKIEEWEPAEHGTWDTGTFTPSMVSASAQGPIGGWNLEDDQLEERTVEIFYDSAGVNLAIDGSAPETVRCGVYAQLDPELAREAAAALYQAAEEHERRPWASGDAAADGGDR